MHSDTALRFDNRSSRAIEGLIVGATIVDPDYQGEIHINLWNVSKHEIVIKCGEKIIQGIFFQTQNIQLDEIDSTSELFIESSIRAQRGFGSSDKEYK
jgi:dUTP pyrophosphatase